MNGNIRQICFYVAWAVDALKRLPKPAVYTVTYLLSVKNRDMYVARKGAQIYKKLFPHQKAAFFFYFFTNESSAILQLKIHSDNKVH
jgi:hypothetical protein